MDVEATWIGPSNCDEKRSARERDIENVWDTLTSTKGYRETYLLLAPAVDLFREALCCYQNGAYMATAIMCRACVETAIYLLSTREIKWCDDLKMVQEAKVDLSLIQVEWKRILREAKTAGYVDDEIELELKRIREAGNFAAHYGQRFDKEIKNMQAEKPMGWITRENALQMLTETVNTLRAL